MAGEPRPPLQLPAPPALAPPEGFSSALLELGIEVSDETLARLGDYLARLLAMNEHMNLTAITDPAEAWHRHILDALTLLPLLAGPSPKGKLIDVGSGGGVPGIPLAIARPSLAVTLVEATQKKATFLTQVAEVLGLANVRVHAERAEKLARADLRGKFDFVTARAVGRMASLLELTVPFVKRGGQVLLIKGQKAEEELAEAAPMLTRLRAEHERTILTPTGRIVVIRRTG